ncbi:calcium-activated potassium channel slowpoke [Eurytemora carolleeae]|uniref:calcium-activated potassium channel slowpoke n=1 Tax=Eurytemora carolleeae TaxID=1294199 RepID=UPI000C75FA61|nr:calcium-activated potassium channel slowpoke [Eurytemora carolleeae]XP_023325742.1 calcium-activated potassium channel slowpoke [Eurytemora carolleeae]XP_023325743.1 calcium-activated potassium channel slowpoke [Eurytemora carolleeae]|eukprot:XP_023325741.1 calcium-activated potassium channel slowpoke-like [Eurytemora affinis]
MHSPYNYTKTQESCQEERKAWIFLLISCSSYFGLLIIVVFFTLLSALCKKLCKPTEVKAESNIEPIAGSSFRSEVREWATSLISGQTTTGRLLVVFIYACNVCAVIVYMIDTSSGLMEECITWVDSITLQIDFALSVIFILHHLLRLLASSTILSFLLEMVTIVDYFTIPPLLASIWMGRTWIGLRYIFNYTTSTSIYMDG